MNPKIRAPGKKVYTGWRKWLPHPALSVFMWGLWLLLMNDISGGHIVIGALLAWFIPWITYPFWPESTPIRKPLVVLRFLMHVVLDILIANYMLMLRILGPTRNLHPAFLTFPLEVKNDFTITILASTISLAPGTVSANLSSDRKSLLVHVLNVNDVEMAANDIKRRYEAPLKEIFECS